MDADDFMLPPNEKTLAERRKEAFEVLMEKMKKLSRWTVPGGSSVRVDYRFVTELDDAKEAYYKLSSLL